MSLNNLYLERYASKKKLIHETPWGTLGLCVIIPCFNEAELLETLQSLAKCDSIGIGVEIIVVINHSLNADNDIVESSRLTFIESKQWGSTFSTSEIRFHIVYVSDLDPKHAGVGLARKIGMDEAVRRLESIGNPNGIIVCLDADSLVDKNYLTAVWKHFIANPNIPGCSIYFEHPYSGNFDKAIYEGIVAYELHLRCYINGLRYAKSPHAFHTIGSCMAVKSNVYQKQGGMNKRKAGEDFYFLQKIINTGGFNDLRNTRVIPSPRPSNRVPFGTGRAISDWLENQSKINMTYNPQIYIELKSLFDSIDLILGSFDQNSNVDKKQYGEAMDSFLIKNQFELVIANALMNTASLAKAKEKIYFWFNGFRILKFVHYARDNFYPNVSVVAATQWSLTNFYNHQVKQSDTKALLNTIRNQDRKYNYRKVLDESA
jgi:glycosyltransferase involved in cell wall biosynthesis